MTAKQVILFDLDGTLTDTSPGIIKSFKGAFAHFGYDEQDESALRKYIGPPLEDSFRGHPAVPEGRHWEGIEKYREIYSAGAMFDNSVYPGMEELLKKLKERGKTLIVATSKAQVFAEPIIEKSGLRPYFDFVAGCEVDGTRARKSEVIHYALSSTGITDYSSVVMVGDTRFDILGAKEAGVANIGVLFGFGSREEFEAAGADCIAEDMPALGKLLLGC